MIFDEFFDAELKYVGKIDVELIFGGEKPKSAC